MQAVLQLSSLSLLNRTLKTYTSLLNRTLKTHTFIAYGEGITGISPPPQRPPAHGAQLLADSPFVPRCVAQRCSQVCGLNTATEEATEADVDAITSNLEQQKQQKQKPHTVKPCKASSTQC
jgi:hypothetical protein